MKEESKEHIIATKENVEDIINRINSFSEGGEIITVKKAWGRKIPPRSFFYNQIYSNNFTAVKHPLICSKTRSKNYGYLIGIKLTNSIDIKKFDELEKQNLRNPNTPYSASIFLLTINIDDNIHFENGNITVTSQVVHNDKNRKRNLVQQIIFK